MKKHHRLSRKISKSVNFSCTYILAVDSPVLPASPQAQIYHCHCELTNICMFQERLRALRLWQISFWLCFLPLSYGCFLEFHNSVSQTPTVNSRKEMALLAWFIVCLQHWYTQDSPWWGGAGPLLPKSSDVLILEFTLSCDPILLNVVGTCCLTSDNRTWPNQRDVTSVIWWIKILSSWLLANSSSWLLCFPEESWHAGETHGAEDRGLLGSSKDLDGDKITKLRSGSFFSQDGDECSPLLIDPKAEDSALLNLDLWSRETMGCNIITT